jgi:hypothetical protein
LFIFLNFSSIFLLLPLCPVHFEMQIHTTT